MLTSPILNDDTNNQTMRTEDDSEGEQSQVVDKVDQDGSGQRMLLQHRHARQAVDENVEFDEGVLPG